MAQYLAHIAPLPGDPLKLGGVAWATTPAPPPPPMKTHLPAGMYDAVKAAVTAGRRAGASKIDAYAEKAQGRVGYGVLVITVSATKKKAVFDAMSTALVGWLQLSPFQSCESGTWPPGPSEAW